jgi:hypothetical protein
VTAAVLPTFHHDCAALLQPRQRAQPMKQLDPNYLDLKHLDPK